VFRRPPAATRAAAVQKTRKGLKKAIWIKYRGGGGPVAPGEVDPDVFPDQGDEPAPDRKPGKQPGGGEKHPGQRGAGGRDAGPVTPLRGPAVEENAGDPETGQWKERFLCEEDRRPGRKPGEKAAPPPSRLNPPSETEDGGEDEEDGRDVGADLQRLDEEGVVERDQEAGREPDGARAHPPPQAVGQVEGGGDQSRHQGPGPDQCPRGASRVEQGGEEEVEEGWVVFKIILVRHPAPC